MQALLALVAQAVELTVDRRTSFLRDASLRDAIGTMTFYPVGMQAAVARRMERIFTSSHASARWIERDFGVSRERLRVVANGVDTQIFRPDPAVPREPSTDAGRPFRELRRNA